MSTGRFWIVSFAAAAALLLLTRWQIQNEYFYFAGYVVLQYVVLATAWNILGGYTGYTNFGTGGIFRVRRLQLGRAAQADLGSGPGDDPRCRR